MVGTVSMLERVQELQAVAVLEEMKKSDVYLDAVKNSAQAPVEFGKALVDEPVDTVKDTAKGLGGFLADVGYSIVSDDPSQENVAKTGLGQAAAVRKFAFQLGVNPYTNYQPLQDLLGEVSWAAVGGGLTVGAAFRAVKNTGGSILTTTRMANTGRELVRDKSPRELSKRNEESLLAMGASASLVDSFLDNYSYNPESETRLVVSLESMKGVSGRADVLARAALANSRNAADEMRDWVELLAALHTQVHAGKALVVLATGPMLVDSSNTVHGVFPTDYIMAGERADTQVQAITQAAQSGGYKLGSIHVTGKMAPAVQTMLKDSGWRQVSDFAERTLRGSQ